MSPATDDRGLKAGVQPPADAATTPARLGFLAIYNAAAMAAATGGDDEDDGHIVYWYGHDGSSTRDERLRQVGLARGLMAFAAGFAAGQAADAVETARARLVLRELEPGWCVVASLERSRIALPPRLRLRADGEHQNGGASGRKVEYSARELKPAALVSRELARAHAVWLLHHGPTLDAALARGGRDRLEATLGRYWDLFLATWPVVLLRGNPAREALGAINLAAGGELGIGVGEEHRGSGEREVLESLTGRIDGLVDLVVSRFDGASIGEPWLGAGRAPAAADGAILLGVGALARSSVRDLTHWLEDLYTWGDDAYGVERSAAREHAVLPPSHSTSPPPSFSDSSGRLAEYLKLGYGTYWGPRSSSSSPPPLPSLSATAVPSLHRLADDDGRFLIGLQCRLDDEADDSATVRITQRSVHVALCDGSAARLRVVVYAAPPFLFAFLFSPRAPALARETVYRALHHQMSPLRRPLTTATSADAAAAEGAELGYEMAWRPAEMVARCGLPNVPAVGRAEAAGTHAQVVAMVTEARTHGYLERTCRTGRGWWISWQREPEHGGGELVTVRRAAERDRSRDGTDKGRLLALPGSAAVDARPHIIDVILGQR